MRLRIGMAAAVAALIHLPGHAVAAEATIAGPWAGLMSDIAHVRAEYSNAGDMVWPGYSAAPSGMLLVSERDEMLLCQVNSPPEFTRIGLESMTGCDAYRRPRGNLPDDLLAAMPIFGSGSTMVMGTPEKTGLARADWMRTMLHEHFHQWQSSRPGYYDRVAGLGLDGGDKTGMWMLNFAFPYGDAKVSKAYSTASLALATALAARGTGGFIPAFDRFLSARRNFSRAAGPRNWRYLEFELWQEGGARWTEYAIAKRDADPRAREAALAGETRLLTRLRKPDLGSQGRELAYVYGTAELMLADACGAGWQQAYPQSTGVGPLLELARRSCRLIKRGTS